jgi:hypothetical protein
MPALSLTSQVVSLFDRVVVDPVAIEPMAAVIEKTLPARVAMLATPMTAGAAMPMATVAGLAIGTADVAGAAVMRMSSRDWRWQGEDAGPHRHQPERCRGRFRDRLDDRHVVPCSPVVSPPVGSLPPQYQ